MAPSGQECSGSKVWAPEEMTTFLLLPLLPPLLTLQALDSPLVEFLSFSRQHRSGPWTLLLRSSSPPWTGWLRSLHFGEEGL